MQGNTILVLNRVVTHPDSHTTTGTETTRNGQRLLVDLNAINKSLELGRQRCAPCSTRAFKTLARAALISEGETHN
jgi:hypothetical protein